MRLKLVVKVVKKLSFCWRLLTMMLQTAKFLINDGNYMSALIHFDLQLLSDYFVFRLLYSMKQTEQFKTTETFLLNFRLITDEGKKPFRFNEVINDLHYCIQINAFERATVISA